MPSASRSRCRMSSVMTRRCSTAARRLSSRAELQWMYDLPLGWCSMIAAEILRECVGAVVIMSRERVGPYMAFAFAGVCQDGHAVDGA
jgi:hypothetical protein